MISVREEGVSKTESTVQPTMATKGNKMKILMRNLYFILHVHLNVCECKYINTKYSLMHSTLEKYWLHNVCEWLILMSAKVTDKPD